MLYQMVELKEGVEVQYLGVHVLKWKHDKWGPPSVGFMERGVFDLVPADQYEQLLQEHKALQELLLAVQDVTIAAQDATIAKLEADTCCVYCGEAYSEGTACCVGQESLRLRMP